MKKSSGLNQVHEAIGFAARAHKGQLRKGTDLDYIVHPLEVLQLLTGMGAGEQLLIAGVLHDTLEDTAVTREELEAAFGRVAAALVAGHTEDKRKSWRERKQNTIEALAKGSREEKMLTLADRISNLRSMVSDLSREGERLWDRFNAPREAQAWYSGGILRALADLRRDAAVGVYWQELAELHEALFGDLQGGLDPALLGNERIDEAIEAYYRTEHTEQLQAALEIIQERMNEDGHLLLPVEYLDEDAEQYRMLTITLPNGLPAAVAFTGEQEIGRGPKTPAISYDIRSALEAVRDNTALSALVLNPWGRSLVISKRLITALLSER